MAILKINNLTIKSKIDNIHIIDKLSLSFKENSFNTIIGKTNSGKTVLAHSIFNILHKNLELESGDILYKEKSIFQIKDYDSYRGNDVAILFNNPRIIFNNNFRVEKQIIDMLLLKKKYNNKKEIRLKLKEFSDLLDLDYDLIASYPKNIDNKNIKKVAIILLLLFKPKIIIIDDSFHRLDSITVKLIYLLLKELKSKYTVLFFTSINSSILTLSDYVHYIYDGKIIESLNYNKIDSYKKIHPYRMLFNNEVSVNSSDDNLTDLSKACIYYKMCFKRENSCLNFENTLKEVEEEHFLSCVED